MSFCQEGSVELQSFKEIILERGYVKDYEINLQRPDGKARICKLSANTRLDDNGSLLGYEGVLRDITLIRERRREEQNLQRKLREEIILAEEKERRSLSLALHEDLAQNLAVLHLKIQEAENQFSPEEKFADPEIIRKHNESLNQSLALINSMIERIRSLVFDLYPVMLDKHGLIPAMKWYAQNFTERTSIPVSLFDTEKTIDLSKPQKIYLFRAFKELLHNAIKHSEATEIVVTISEDEGRLRLTVDDDGVGFKRHQVLDDSSTLTAASGIGLLSIQEWVSVMSGDLQIESMPGQGTRIIINIPLLKDKRV
jgi:signal transduction histidine kinase